MLAIGAASMIALFALLVIVPPLASIFGMTAIGLNHWLIVIGLSTIPTIVAEIGKLIRNRGEIAEHKNRLVRHAVPIDV